jgi:CheY-like chemotaxis protein
VVEEEVEEDVYTAVPEAGQLVGKTILVVDDDREGRELLHAVLRHAGANVVTADSAGAAWKHLRESNPDLILTDIAMPGVDGFAFTRELRSKEETRSKKIVALSAFPPGANAAATAGFDLYLVKPIEPALLIGALVRVLS